jgi:hypothetical protein
LAAAHAVDETTTNLDLRLQPGLTISAKVQEADGKPIPTAAGTLFIYPETSGIGSSITRAAPVNADAQGRVQFTALPQGYRYSVTVRAPGYGSPQVPMIQAAQTQTTRLDLAPVVLKLANLKLAGQVLGADGQPAAGVRVSTAGAGQAQTNAPTDATGHFSFIVCDGPVTVTAFLQGASDRTNTVGGDTNVVLRLPAVNNPATSTMVLPNNNPAVSGSVTITGIVFDPSGAPAPGVTFLVTPGGALNQDLKSDAGGKFAVSWRPLQFPPGAGPQNIVYLLVGRDLEHNFATTVEVDEKTTNLDLHLQAGLALSGSVQDNEGAPVKTATLRLFMTAARSTAMIDPQAVQVDEQGAFRYSALPPGRAYRLNVTAPGFGNATAQVAETETQTARLQLPPIQLKPADQRLEGQVVGPDDKPMPGVTVRVNGPGQPSASAPTDANGHFALKVCEGMVRVMASVQPGAANGQFLSGNVQAQAGDLNVVVKLAGRQVAPVPVQGPGAGLARPPAALSWMEQSRQVPLKEPIWSWAGILDWPQQHRVAMIVLICAQIAVLLGTAGAVFWRTRAPRSQPAEVDGTPR